MLFFIMEKVREREAGLEVLYLFLHDDLGTMGAV
jgi:hypothetical protein